VRGLALDWPRRMRGKMPTVDIDALIASYVRPGYEEYWTTTAAFVHHSATNSQWWLDLKP
jgi:hypothetical protein